MELLSRERERERESRIGSRHIFNYIISVENLLVSWQEFLRGKRKRKDVTDFSLHFTNNIFNLQRDLAAKIYRHGSYQAFKINDPKPRNIHKASVRDRLVHHAICRMLGPYFDQKFIFDSYSCRLGKGTHRAMNRFRYFAKKVSRNNTRTAWVLKGDIKKFFASIDHRVLKGIIAKQFFDQNVFWLLGQIIDSFNTEGKSNVGLPLGNLTSQLLINIYLNEFDQFVKRKLRIKYYLRYADDFIILHEDSKYLENIIPDLREFLKVRLKLSLHPDKLFIKTLNSGVDFLGWVHFSHQRVLRTSTKRRMLSHLQRQDKAETLESYLGLLTHGNAYKLSERIANYQSISERP